MSSESRAERLYGEFLESFEKGEVRDLEEWCVRHPADADALRRLHEALRSTPAFPTFAHAEAAEAAEEEDADTYAASLIERLRSRGPGYKRYVFRGEVGRGGMGVVHHVYDQDADRELAFKVMIGPGGSADDAAAHEGVGPARFLSEARITSQLDHPGIVPVHEIGVDDRGRVYFTMRLVNGESLGDVFAKVWDDGDHEWTMTRAIETLTRVSEAVSYAHAKGVVHRDIKPSNVMVGRFGETYVLDWGVAKVVGEPDLHDLRVRSEDRPPSPGAAAERSGSPALTMDGRVIGTPQFMAPEQANSLTELICPATDVYAMGAMLYTLFARQAPFHDPDEDQTAREVLHAVVLGPPRPLGEQAPQLPGELIAIVEKAMAREIGDRYPSMTALARDLRAYLERQVVSAYEVGAWAEMKKWMLRNSGIVRTAGVAILMIVSLAIWSHVTVRGQRDQLLQLSDRHTLARLLEEQHHLWPARPELVPRMRDWVTSAESFLEHLPNHEETLASLETEMAASGRGSADEDFRWWRDLLTELIEGMHALRAADEFEPTVVSMHRRIRAAESLIKASVTAPDVTERWEAARQAIERHERYGGLELTPQIGLVPLGPDPDSTLWEFAHVQSGATPDRDPGTGRLRISEESGLVFVLIPGGTATVGIQEADPDAPNYWRSVNLEEEGGVRDYDLLPFFLSKYEMTQGQWTRARGRNPSRYTRETNSSFYGPTHPVEQVTWDDAVETARRLDLRLPTEVQWEYACRAGTTTKWSFGNVPASFLASVNFLGKPVDGRQRHGSILEFAANGWGLHSMHGNVWEWCADQVMRKSNNTLPGRSGDGLRAVEGADCRVCRGGGFDSGPKGGHSGNRAMRLPQQLERDVGLRPAREVTPASP